VIRCLSSVFLIVGVNSVAGFAEPALPLIGLTQTYPQTLPRGVTLPSFRDQTSGHRETETAHPLVTGDALPCNPISIGDMQVSSLFDRDQQPAFEALSIASSQHTAPFRTEPRHQVLDLEAYAFCGRTGAGMRLQDAENADFFECDLQSIPFFDPLAA
jgi:hypothetical protein